MLSSIEEHFRAIEDPRVERNKKHKLLDIIVLAICGVVSGAEGWEAIEEFGYEKQQWLRKYLELANGIPSHDCIARVLSRISPSEMTECFIAWTRSVSQLTAGEVVAIDGKTLRHSTSFLQYQRETRRNPHGQCMGFSGGTSALGD
jgi:predicted transposase YbfD/YdcC